MRSFLPWLLLAIIPLSAAPPTAADDAEGPSLHILHDVAPDGYTFVGTPNAFGYILLDADGTPTVHKQGKIRVTLNDRLLYETTLDAGHDYDALNTFVIAFPHPGNFTVHAEVPVSGSTTATADFSGFVVPNRNDVNATLVVEGRNLVPLGRPVDFAVTLNDAQGNIIPHSDALVEVRRPDDGWLTFRTHLHTHADPMTFSYLFPETGTWTVRVTGYNAYPTSDSPHYAAVTKDFLVRVEPSALSAPTPTPPALALPAPTSGPAYVLLTSIDPQDENTLTSRTTVSALVYDPGKHEFVQHVDFTARLIDPFGEVQFASSTLHEYDGDYDLTFQAAAPGRYLAEVAASYGDWAATVVVPITIATPVPPVPSGAPAVIVTAQGLEDYALGAPVQFHARTPAGVAAKHSEIDFTLRNREDVLIFQNKIHTHDSGDFEVHLGLWDAAYADLDPLTIHGDPSLRYYYGAVGGALRASIGEVEAPALPEPPADDLTPPQPPRSVAGVGVGLVLVALAGFALLRRRA